jgi:phosphatidylserine/phosphatidylglycerophosphate/cardiolipin synthase-like enzyme
VLAAATLWPDGERPEPNAMILEAGSTCWRTERASRAAVLIDMAAYFAAARSAFEAARRSIHILCWAFDPDTLFEPEPGGGGPAEGRIGPFLTRLAAERPELDVRILCWRSSLPIAATQRFFPHRAKKCFEGTRVRFLLDAEVPMGACHHQKVVVIDDTVAFCGGGDICPDRWDTPEHRDDDPRREKSEFSSVGFTSRHEVMSVVEGPAAAALGQLFRERWARATGQRLAPGVAGDDGPWPKGLAADFTDCAVGLSRTVPRWRRFPAAREVEALHLAAIARARRCIYLENQYFAAPVVAEALARRLAEPDGPEVVMIGARHSPSWFDRMTMDRTRTLFLRELQAADSYGRLRAYTPSTAKGRLIIVHAKLMIIDDRLVRIGSANLNNRSGGFDTECDLSIEAGRGDEPARAAIAGLRTRLLAHWLGAADHAVESAIGKAGGVGPGVDALIADGYDRLGPMQPARMGPLAAIIATGHLGDPLGPGDSWRPWRRPRAIRRDRAQIPPCRAV